MTDAAITTAGLTREYEPGIGAIDVDLDVPPGCIYGFLGPNGAGKTTTIRMLVGIVRPDRGSATVLGLDPRTDKPALHERIGVMSGEAAVARHHTGGSLLALVGRLRGDQAGIVGRGRDLAERFDLALDRPARDLSLGNRQKLGLVMALAHRPALVILDEPSNGLDPLMQRELEALLRELADAGTTVLLSSHSLPEVERVADRVGFIRAARLVEQTALRDLAARAVRRAVVGFDRVLTDAEVSRVDGIAGVTAASTDGGQTLRVSWQGPVAELLGVLGGLGAMSIEARGADLEETFLALYDDGAEEAA